MIREQNIYRLQTFLFSSKLVQQTTETQSTSMTCNICCYKNSEMNDFKKRLVLIIPLRIFAIVDAGGGGGGGARSYNR